jgi:hypothetical protein
LETLYEVVNLYANKVHNKYKISIFNTLTVPSLAMKVFRSNYLMDKNVTYIDGQLDRDMRNGYYGGIVAAIKEEVKDGYYYDVNSAYPAAMIKDLPIGAPSLVKCNSLEGVFGMVKAKVTAPLKTVNNILPLPMRDDKGVTRYEHGMTSTGF